MSPELTAAFDRLEIWTNALVNSVTDEVPAARATMTEERTTPLPSGASLGSLAHMELGGTRKALNEVRAACAEIDRRIMEEGGEPAE